MDMNKIVEKTDGQQRQRRYCVTCLWINFWNKFIDVTGRQEEFMTMEGKTEVLGKLSLKYEEITCKEKKKEQKWKTNLV